MDRFQSHFGNISREDTTTLINDHFNKLGHNGVKDMEIHIVEFIHADAKGETGKNLRLKLETAWISKLRTAFPIGLNYLE